MKRSQLPLSTRFGFLSVAFLSLFVLSGFATPVRAQRVLPGGYWQLTTTISGTTTYVNTNDVTGTSSTIPLIWHNSTGPIPVLVGGHTVVGDFTGNVTFTLQFLDGGGHPSTPPAGQTKVYLRVESSASWSSASTVASRSGSAKDGLDDSEKPNSSGGVSSGKHLLTLDGTSGSVTVNKSLSAHISASNPINSTSSGGIYVGGKVAGFVDTRGVTLYREGGAHNETFDSDGTVHGDTTFSYKNVFFNGEFDSSSDQINWQIFHPFFIGGWSTKWGTAYTGNSAYIPDVSWSWNPWESENTWDTGKDSMVMGTKYSRTEGGTTTWKGDADSPQTTVITYKATDNLDGAEADASYVLTLHDVLEVKTEQTENVTMNPRAVGLEWINRTVGGTAKLQVTESVAYGVKVTWTDIFGLFFLEWAKINLELSYTGTTTTGMTIDVNNLPVDYGTHLECVDLYTHDYGVESQYDAGGYIGPVNYSVLVPMSPGFAIELSPYTYYKRIP